MINFVTVKGYTTQKLLE